MMYFLIQIIFSVVDDQSRYADNGPISWFRLFLFLIVFYIAKSQRLMSTPKVLLSRTKNTAAESFAMPFYKQLICITFSCI